MDIILRLELTFLGLLFLIFTLKIIKKDILVVKYSILWFTIATLLLLSAILPETIFYLSKAFGFQSPMNFLFLAGIITTLIITFILTIIVSTQARRIKTLAEEVSLLKGKK